MVLTQPTYLCSKPDFSAAILPGVDKDSSVKHRVDVSAEGVLRLEVCLVDRMLNVNTTVQNTAKGVNGKVVSQEQ